MRRTQVSRRHFTCNLHGCYISTESEQCFDPMITFESRSSVDDTTRLCGIARPSSPAVLILRREPCVVDAVRLLLHCRISHPWTVNVMDLAMIMGRRMMIFEHWTTDYMANKSVVLSDRRAGISRIIGRQCGNAGMPRIVRCNRRSRTPCRERDELKRMRCCQVVSQ